MIDNEDQSVKIGAIKRLLCFTHLGIITDIIAPVGVRECYCCTVWRTLAVAGIPLFCLGFVLGRFL